MLIAGEGKIYPPSIHQKYSEFYLLLILKVQWSAASGVHVLTWQMVFITPKGLFG